MGDKILKIITRYYLEDDSDVFHFSIFYCGHDDIAITRSFHLEDLPGMLGHKRCCKEFKEGLIVGFIECSLMGLTKETQVWRRYLEEMQKRLKQKLEAKQSITS